MKKFWAWAETKTGLCWSRIKLKVLDKFPALWIFNMSTCSNSIPSFAFATGIMGLNMNMWTCSRSKMFETCQAGKHHQNILNSLADHSKRQIFFNALLQTKVSNSLQERQLRGGNVRKILFFTNFSKKWALKQKVPF